MPRLQSNPRSYQKTIFENRFPRKTSKFSTGAPGFVSPPYAAAGESLPRLRIPLPSHFFRIHSAYSKHSRIQPEYAFFLHTARIPITAVFCENTNHRIQSPAPVRSLRAPLARTSRSLALSRSLIAIDFDHIDSESGSDADSDQPLRRGERVLTAASLDDAFARP